METGRISEGSGGSPGLLSSGSDKGESGQFWLKNHIAHRRSNNHPEALPSSGFSALFFMDLPGSEAARLALAGTGISGTGNHLQMACPAQPYWPKTTACMIRPGRK